MGEDFELERSDRSEERDTNEGLFELKGLSDSFPQQLIEAFAKTFLGGGAVAVEESKTFGGEPGHFVELDGGVFGQGVADLKIVVADDPDHIAWPCAIDGFAVTREETLGVGESDGLAGSVLCDGHIPLELPGDDTDESDAIPVFRVHVGLDFEDKAGECFVGGGDHPIATGPWRGRRGHLEEGIEEELDAKVIHGAPEENGSQTASGNFAQIEVGPGAGQEGNFFDELGVGSFQHAVANEGIPGTGDFFGGTIGTLGSSFEEMDLPGASVENSAEFGTVTERPIDGNGMDSKNVLQLIDQIERLAGRTIELIHEGENGNASTTADFEEFARLGLDALPRIDNHDGGVHGGENPVGVFRKIFVTGSVEKVHDATAVLELEHGGGNGNAPLFFEFHPIAGGGPLIFSSGHASGHGDSTAVEEKFFGQRRLAGIRVRDDCEGSAIRGWGEPCGWLGGGFDVWGEIVRAHRVGRGGGGEGVVQSPRKDRLREDWRRHVLR